MPTMWPWSSGAIADAMTTTATGPAPCPPIRTGRRRRTSATTRFPSPTARPIGWRTAGIHALRLEVHRQDTPSGGSYLIEVWIDGSGRNFADVTADYTGETPQIAYTATMDAVDHRKLDTILFGWTEGSGRSPQTVDVHDFNLEFRR